MNESTSERIRGHGDDEMDLLVLGDLLGRAGHAPQECFQRHRLAAGLHHAGVEPDEIEQVVDELEQPEAVAVHCLEQADGVGVQGIAIAGHDGFERGDHQRERGAQLVADVGEEPAFDLVELGELLVAGLELLLVQFQFVIQEEFTEAKAVEEDIAGDDDDAGAVE